MSVFKEILPSDIKSVRSFLNQLVDVLQQDVSSSVSRRKYQTFVTGGVGPGVTSSLFQTVYDSDFTLQTSNALFDMAVGLQPGGPTVLTSQTGVDAAGKELFPSSSLMMREKMDVYRQFSQALLGDSTLSFSSPVDSSVPSDTVDVALFIAFKRLFARDSIKRETFGMRFYQSASAIGPNAQEAPYSIYPFGSGSGMVNGVFNHGYNWVSNINLNSTSGSATYTDIGAATNKLSTFGGQVGNVVDASNTNTNVGLLFYDRGILVLDLVKVTSASQYLSGTIDAMASLGNQVLGASGTQTQFSSKFIPDFVVSASIDNIVDHLAFSRFGSGSTVAVSFQNVTNINSTLVFCRAAADEFNYSSNPTFTDSSNRIQVIDVGQEDVQSSFTYLTAVGLYDANDNLLAVAKVSRPIQKSSERDLTLRIRLDF